jgi:hypothetical protein
VKYESNPAMASGMMSNIAIERNKLPEKVMATDMIWPSLKHLRFEMNLPNMTTSKKNANIRQILIIIEV